MVPSRARTCQRCGSFLLSLMLVCEVCEPVVERLVHGAPSDPGRGPWLDRPVAVVSGKEHPAESQQGFAGLSLTYEIAAITTSSVPFVPSNFWPPFPGRDPWHPAYGISLVEPIFTSST